MEICLIGARLLAGAPPSAIADDFASMTTTMMGPAYGGAAVPLGVALHFGVAIGWALGYVYLIRTRPQLLERPLISGLAFGFVVWTFLQIVLLAAGHASDAHALGVQLIAHMVFYGVPVAYVASAMLRRARPDASPERTR